MRNKIKILFFILVISFACFLFYDFFSANQVSSLDESSMSDPIIKNVPRISQHYQVKHGDAEGPGKQVIGIYFENTTDIDTLRKYVNSLKFKLSMDDGYREVWESPDKSKFIVLSVNHEEHATYFEVLL